MVAIETVEIEGSGRGLVAVTPIAAGELVLRESPVILTVTQELHQAVCTQCLRYINGEASSRMNPSVPASKCSITHIFCQLQLLQRFVVKHATKPPFATSAVSKGLPDRLTPQTFAGKPCLVESAVHSLPQDSAEQDKVRELQTHRIMYISPAARWPELSWTISLLKWQTKLVSSSRLKL